MDDIDAIFSNVKASDYWNDRFNFGKTSTIKGEKSLTKEFVELILINAILPLKYAYHKNFDEDAADEILEFYRKITPEKNSIITSWNQLQVKTESALQSQAFLYHHKNFCLKKDCLNCGIGFQLLKNN